MSFDRFQMEQQILDCWRICDDLETLNDSLFDESLDADQISNVLSGLRVLYELKFQNLFEQFEELTRLPTD